MDNRNDFQKIETEPLVTFLLFRYREWHKNADLVHADSPLVAQCNQGIIEKQKSISDCSGINTDTLDKSFRFDVGSNRGQTRLHQAQNKPQQEPCNRTNFHFLMGVDFKKKKLYL